MVKIKWGWFGLDDSVFLLISLLTQIFFKIYKESSSALTPTVTKKKEKKERTESHIRASSQGRLAKTCWALNQRA